FFHSFLINDGLTSEKGDYFISFDGDFNSSLYNKLMKKYDLPILYEWIDYIKDMLFKRNLLYECNFWSDTVRNTSAKGKMFKSDNWKVYGIRFNNNELKNIVSFGLKSKNICISPNKQKKLQFHNLDEYYTNYGHTAVENLLKKINPLTELKGTVDIITKKKTPFPKQAMIINGAVELLKESSYCIINGGMGVGKTLMSSMISDKYHQDRIREVFKIDSLSELTQKSAYRTIVMCPGHLTEKWKEEIEIEIPLAKAVIINKFEQLIELKNKKNILPKTKEFYIISKDFCKLSYQKRPAPFKRGRRRVKRVSCESCKCDSTLHYYKTKGSICPECNKDALKLKDLGYTVTGWICPDCGEVIYPNIAKLKLDKQEHKNIHEPLGLFDFINQNSKNSFCHNCNSELWTPHLKNLEGRGEFSQWVKKKENSWIRISHYRNKSKKGNVSVWVPKHYLKNYLFENEIQDDEWSYVLYSGARKYAPSLYIKKYLKKFFDVGIFDEAHLYKGGNTAQGHAFHMLIMASKKRKALTGTIAGGVASHLFYLLFRLDSKRMIERGYKYEDEYKFARDYGVVETSYIYDSEDEYYNSSSKGRRTGSPKIKAGISPLIYPHFLIDKTLYLDLTDLAAFLPDLIEETILVDMPALLLSEYFRVLNSFKELLREKGGKKLLSTMLQTLLALPDKPFGLGKILHPESGREVVSLPELDRHILYSKEEHMIKIINKELKEGRRSFVYTEYTGGGEKDNTKRLKKIIEDNCNLKGQVAILKSNSPSASKRMGWIKKKAKEGYKVIISNPKCVETGRVLVSA
ncbi:MAG: hypothetical protein MJA82_02120, partial [Clostridia bacterium]|nr:hypothetical protein [Clostridia bacterium]